LFGNGNGKVKEKLNGNSMGMKINFKILNGNEK